MSDPATRFADAATTVADLVDSIAPGSWAGPGLGAWDLRALVGHTGRALVTVSTRPHLTGGEAAVGSAAEYYALARSGATDAEAVAERGRQAGAQLGDDPGAAFRALVEPATTRVAALGPDAVLDTIAGPMLLRHYLATRTFELVVHGLDIAAAAGRPVEFAPDVLGETLGLAADVAVRLGEGVAVLLALTGRRPLPAGFCVV